MCRWLAYSGPPITLDTLLTQPEHSLLDQSVNARLNMDEGIPLTTNGDGFGIGWYGIGDGPGLFRDLRPAWANENLASLAAHLSAPVFLAHIRAASAGRVQESNCHPFRYGRWLFQHNGGIGSWPEIRRSLQIGLLAEHFAALEGSTDSETCFHLALEHGLEHDVQGALARMVRTIDAAQRKVGVEAEQVLTLAVTDGQALWALRWASPGIEPPTLFVSRRCQAMHKLHVCYEAFPEGGQVLVSEPLDSLEEHWLEIPAGSLVRIEAGEMETLPFEP